MTDRPHGLDDLAGVAEASTVPPISLPMPFVRELTAYVLDLERRVASVESTPAPIGAALLKHARAHYVTERPTRYPDMRVRPIRPGAWGITITGMEYVLEQADADRLAALLAEARATDVVALVPDFSAAREADRGRRGWR